MKPVFEFYDEARRYKIFADGRVEGGTSVTLVVNSIPLILNCLLAMATATQARMQRLYSEFMGE